MNQALPFSVYAFLVGVSLVSRILAASVSLAWDPNTDPNVVGYRIYYGPLSTKLQIIDTGSATSLTITNLLAGATYQFYATAYDSTGLESAPSGTITYAVPAPIVGSTTTDSDGDGLPDAYELANGLNPYDPSDALADSDGDGLTNLQEFYSGTDPNDPGSSLRITAMNAQGGNVVIQFTTILGRTYVLQANDSFPSGPWTALSSSVIGTGAEMQIADTISASSAQRMYRIITVAPNQTQVSSEVAGFQRLNFQARSDTITSTPLFRPAAFEGTVANVAGTSILLNGANWPANRFAYVPGGQTNTYFVLFRGGLREGESFIVTGNSANALNLETYGDTLWGVTLGDPVSVIPFWTVATIFPGGQGIVASSSPAVRATEILVPDIAGIGINLAMSFTYYFYNGAWRQVGDGTTVHNDDVLLPDMFFWVRQNTSASTQLLLPGVALVAKWRFPIYRNAAANQDNVFSMPRPVSVSLNGSGLIESGAFRPSPSPLNRLDELFVFDNSASGQNKSAVATYYYCNNAWRKVGDGGGDAGNDLVLNPGTGFIIRSAPGASLEWVNSSPF